MTRLTPVDLEVVDPETRAMIDNAEKLMGFIPNDALIMARHPALTRAMRGPVAEVRNIDTTFRWRGTSVPRLSQDPTAALIAAKAILCTSPPADRAEPFFLH